MDQSKEKLRLKTIKDYLSHISTIKDKLKDIVVLATDVTGISAAYISIMDEHVQHIAVQHGNMQLENEIPRSHSFCSYTLDQNELLIVDDLTKDARFKSNPFVINVPWIKFYAGIPLKTHDGISVGTLCVVDTVPRHLTVRHIEALMALSRQVTFLMKLNITNDHLRKSIVEIEQKNKALRQIAQLQSHEVRGPLTTILGLIHLINEEGFNHGKNYLQLLNSAVNNLDQKIRSIVKISSEASQKK